MSYLQLFLSGFHSPRLYIGLPMYILGLFSLSYLVSWILVLGGLWSCLLLSSFWSYTVSELSGSRLFFPLFFIQMFGLLSGFLLSVWED